MLGKHILEHFLIYQNLGIKPLSRQLNISPNTLSKWCKFYDIPIKKVGYRSWAKGLTKETDKRIRKMSETKKNKTFPQLHKLRISEGLRGHTVSDITKRKIGKANSKGGLTPLHILIRTSFRYRLWRSDVFTRDDFICRECGRRRSGKLNAHHLMPFALIMEINDIITFEQAMNCEELWNINNGITLCEECHQLRKLQTMNQIKEVT